MRNMMNEGREGITGRKYKMPPCSFKISYVVVDSDFHISLCLIRQPLPTVQSFKSKNTDFTLFHYTKHENIFIGVE